MNSINTQHSVCARQRQNAKVCFFSVTRPCNYLTLYCTYFGVKKSQIEAAIKKKPALSLKFEH